MRKLSLTLCGLSVLLSGCLTTQGNLNRVALAPPVSESPRGRIVWEVENRDRIINGEDEEIRFRHYLSAYIDEYKEWFSKEPFVNHGVNILNSDLLHTARAPFRFRPDSVPGPGDNFATRYDTLATSYRCAVTVDSLTHERICRTTRTSQSWVTDPERTIRLSVPAYTTRQCVWSFDQSRRPGPCVGMEAHVVVGRPLDVSAQLEGSAEQTHTERVVVGDLKIVALGDSYSAGEGNPHSQWRLFTFRPRPAVWLDPRCHRSLMSAPSLTAAYIALHNPHISVTLLHYGCAGASIADGLATPWAHIETSESVDIRWSTYQALGIRRPPDQQTARVNPQLRGAPRPGKDAPIDYPASQIEQAVEDLGGAGAAQKPDIILVTVGGNDLGFAGLVRALSVHTYTPDLAPGHIEDLAVQPPVQSFDEDMWVRVRAEHDDCGQVVGVDCLEQHVAKRIGKDNPISGTLTSQFDVLDKALKPLVDDQPGKVFLNDYPNFVLRWKDDSAKPLPPPGSPAETVGCDDKVLDGRVGLVPAIDVWLNSSDGLKQADAEQVQPKILDPLNGAISAASQKYGWHEVRRHASNGKLHGYCSFRRYYNTWADSFWNQGHMPTTLRPLGNFVLEAMPASPLRVEGGRALVAKDRIVWNPGRGCFLIDPPGRAPASDEQGCVRDGSGFDPVFYDYSRDLDGSGKRVAPPREVASGSITDTTGPVHPNLFGHCNFAASMITEIVASKIVSAKLDPVWASSIPTDAVGLTARDLCKPEAWGYFPVRTASRRQTSADASDAAP